MKIIINIQEPPGLPYKGASLYFYHEAGDHLAAVKVGEIESASGMLAYQNRTDWQQLFDTGRDLYTFDGAAVVYNDEHYYIGDFQDKNRKGYNLVCKEPSKEANAKSIELSKEAEQKILYRPGNAKRVIREENSASQNTEKTDQQVQNAEQADELLQKAEYKKQQEVKEKVEEKKQQAIKQEIECNELAKEQIQPEAKKDVFEKCENCPYHKKRMEQKEQADTTENLTTDIKESLEI